MSEANSVKLTADAPNKNGYFHKLWKRMWKNRWFYLFVLPAVIIMFLFCYRPMYGIIIAFKDFKVRKGILGSEWVGLYNFKRMLTYGNFGRLLYNTLYISVLKLVLGTLSTLILAMLFNEISNMKFKRVVQSLSYLPHFISWVILGGIIRDLFSPTRGVVNELVKLLGHEPIYFLANEHYFVGVVIFTHIWQSIGWGTIIYLAAISSIDQEQYESAIVDGASRFKRCIYITIPNIAPTIITLLILNVGGILSAGFDQIFNLYNDSVLSVGDIIDTYVYRVGLVKFDYSYSAAIGLFKNVVGIILVVGSNMAVKVITKGEHKIW